MNDKASSKFSSEGDNGISIASDDERIDSKAVDALKAPTELPVAKKSVVKIIITCAAVIFAGALLYFALTRIDFRAISDHFSAIGYEAPTELSKIIDDIQLTEEGRRILMATRPELQDADAFNESCTIDPGSYTLGCYYNNRIYVYNITSEKVSGARQSTLAHELLHAAWDRLSSSDKDALKAALDEVLEGDAELRSHLEMYSEDSHYDELHSIVGTQVATDRLPEILQKHYAKYFMNQSKVVAYFNEYYEPFTTARKRREELETLIKEHRTAYEEMLASYNADNEQLTTDINTFNQKNQSHGFKTVDEFVNERESLVLRQKKMYERYQALILYYEETNALINEYNSNVARTKSLEEAVNSQAQQP